jgi:hypothetical protein
MADREEYDELIFKMANGDELRRYVPTGDGLPELASVGDGDWLEIDNTTRIRVDKIVSVTANLNAHESPGIVY